MSTKPKPVPKDHVVIDAVGQVMRCDHCKDHGPLPMGLVPFVTAVLKAFSLAHKKCKSGDRGGRTWFSEPTGKSTTKRGRKAGVTLEIEVRP